MSDCELHGLRKDGSHVPIALGRNSLVIENVLQAAYTVLDLTEIHQGERDLVRFFELSLDLFCIANLDGFFVRVNSNFLRVLGFTSEELVSFPMVDFVHPADRKATLAAMTTLESGAPVTVFRNRYRDIHGDFHWFEWLCKRTPNERTVFAIARDVTQRVCMEQELRAREQRERDILENSTAVVYVKGADYRYQYVNQKFTDLFALNRGGIVGKTDYDLFPQKVADEFRKNDQRVIETAEVVNLQEIAPHADGDHTYVSVKFPLLDGAGKVDAVAGVSTDITVQIRAREMERELHFAQLVQQRLYPTADPLFPGMEVAGAARPAAIVSGDYFDYMIRDGQRLVIAVGDVAGHGFGPALEMVQVRTVLRMLLRSAASLQVAVEELNHWLCTDLGDSAFVTLLLAEIDMDRRECQYVGAGHEGFLFKANGETRRLPSTGLALGILPDASFFTSPPIPLVTGDLLALFTDGLTDAMNAADERFGVTRLVEVLGRHRDQPPAVLLETLFKVVFDFAKGRIIDDDMTAVLAKVLEPASLQQVMLAETVNDHKSIPNLAQKGSIP